MLTSERQWKLKEAVADLELFQRDLATIMLTLADAQRGGESAGPVAGGDRPDPTATTAALSLQRSRDIDRAIARAHIAAAALGRLRQGVIGHDGLTVPRHEQGVDVCELHRLVLVEDEAAQGRQGLRLIGDAPLDRVDIPPGRRWVVDSSGNRFRACRWCGDLADRLGRMPYLIEVRWNVEGRKVQVRETGDGHKIAAVVG